MPSRSIADPQQAISLSKLVHRYFTPFALALVCLSVPALGWNRVTRAAVALATLSTAGNLIFVAFIQRYPAYAVSLRNLRIGFNYSFNIVLIYLLLPSWPPIWLLFHITLLGIAVYDTRKSTIVNACLFSFVLGLFVNELAHPRTA